MVVSTSDRYIDYMRTCGRDALIPFLSCMESLRFSFSLMLDMFAFAVWFGKVLSDVVTGCDVVKIYIR
jgi:hypothetical protein